MRIRKAGHLHVHQSVLQGGVELFEGEGAPVDVAGLSARGVPCTLAVYEDEGHGLARLANRLDAYPRAIRFLDTVLGRGVPVSP